MTAARSRLDITDVKARNPLGSVVEAAGVKLMGTGRVRQARCPFHDESEGSFTVYSDSQRWYCFGCGEGGDVIDFVQRTQSVPLAEALRILGAAEPRLGGIAPSTPPVDTESSVEIRNRALLTSATRFYAGQLRRHAIALEYLSRRGIAAATALRLGLGYATGAGLREALASDGFGHEATASSGLFTEHGAERFAGMIVIPDVADGRVGWLGGRAIARGTKPRFQALPGPKPVLGLSRLPYNLDWVVVTEGVFDWLTLTQWGIPACAALGTQGIERIAQAVARYPRVFVAFDEDDAGHAAAERLTALLGRRSAVVRPPGDTLDVAELAELANGQARFIAQLRHAALAARA